MSGNFLPEFTHLSSASSYSGTCHLPMPAAPISRMKAVASAISCASCADQEPPARRCVGAKNSATRGPWLDRGLEPLRQRLIRRVVAQEPALHSMHHLEPGRPIL